MDPDPTTNRRRRPLGLSFLIGFFCFGLAMCSLAVLLLLFPSGPLRVLWQIKPTARDEFVVFGSFAIPLMIIVGAACGSAAVGLVKGAGWGRRVALGVLIVNFLGDLTNAILRSDWHTLIGLPIGGMMIVYLTSSHTRGWFEARRTR